MKIVFVSNYFNHHQKSLSEALDKLTDHNFHFVATSKMREERRKFGYGNWELPEYVIEAYTGQDAYTRAMDAIDCTDAVIAGSAPELYLKQYIKSGKLLFRYSERPFKKDASHIKFLPRYIKWHLQNPHSKPIYMLCASAYTCADYAKYGLWKNKFYKWGYFPECKRYENIEKQIAAKEKKTLLWCGRFLDWKHPDDAVKIAAKLRDNGYDFHLNMIGTGEMEMLLSQMIQDNHLEEYVSVLGSMPPENVREHMECAGIYLFTSDKQEGWGAVLNESMNAGCAVVASHAAGAVPFLLKNGENGAIYESGNTEELFQKVKELLDNPDKQERMGAAAYHTITNEWNAEIAAQRLMDLSERILHGEKSPDIYGSGLCSQAEMITDTWYTAAKQS